MVLRGHPMTSNQVPDNIEDKDDNEDTAYPKYGKKIIGVLTVEFRKVRGFDQQSSDKNNG